MKIQHVFWLICSTLAIASGAPKAGQDDPAHIKKDIINNVAVKSASTAAPGEIVAPSGDNWDSGSSKDKSQSALFLNKSDKNDLEPYPMALSDEASYDGRPELIEHQVSSKMAPLMRAELYGEPPSMGSEPAEVGATNGQRIRKRTLRFKRDSGLKSEDILALLSLWEAQRRHYNEPSPSYYSKNSYYNNQVDPYEEEYSKDQDSADEQWMEEPVIPSAHFSNPYYEIHQSLQNKPNHYRNFPEYSPEPNYLENLEARRRKRQWTGFGNVNRVAKRFMVAKKRAEVNPLYYQATPKNYQNQEDLYSLSELLKSSRNPSGLRLSRRMVL